MSYMGWPPKYVYNLDGILGWYFNYRCINNYNVIKLHHLR